MESENIDPQTASAGKDDDHIEDETTPTGKVKDGDHIDDESQQQKKETQTCKY